MMLVAAMFLTGLVTASGQATSTTGSIAGCMTDTGNQMMPGTTVHVKGGGIERTVVTDTSGCYEAKALPPGSYRVTAVIAGFDHETRDRVVVMPSNASRADFTMRISAICECIDVKRDLKGHFEYADAVLHVRLSDAQPIPSTPRGYYRHRATVVTVVKLPDGSNSNEVHVLQNQRSGSPLPYDVGQELVVLLKSVGPGEFTIVSDEPHLSLDRGAFLVANNRIRQTPPEFSRYVGVRTAAFLDQLRRTSRDK